MSIFEKQRFEIWNQGQHPFKHNLSDFGYSNTSTPSGVTNVQSALDYLFAVLYPNTKAAVATPADLPASGNSLNDYRVVTDDGDGKAAGYRWEQREGDAAAKWYKIYDMDWGQNSVLAQFLAATQDQYVYKQGKTDLDSSGNAITGTFAGQRVVGGNLASQNLTLLANSGDAAGAHTGYVQVDNNFRPTTNGLYSLGTLTEKFVNAYFSGTLNVGTLQASSGLLSDTSGSLSFGSTALTTTGTLHSGATTVNGILSVLSGATSVLVQPGSYTDSTGAINFGVSALSGTGNLSFQDLTLTKNAHTLVLTGDNGSSKASILSSFSAIDFGSSTLSTSGNFSATNATLTQLTAGNVRASGNTVTTTSGNLTLDAFTGSTVIINKALTSLGITSTGVSTFSTSAQGGNVLLSGTTVSTTTTNADLTLSPNGSGNVVATASILPSADNADTLGSASKRFTTLNLSTGISDGTTTVASSVLQSLRDINVGVGSNFTIFWNGSKWVASAPDSEISHPTLSGLLTGDAGHTQFALLAGRSGGQTLVGDTAASGNLTLGSTAHATKGSIFFQDTLLPSTTASYSGTWSGTDLGGSSNYLRDIYTKGQHFGFRVENVTAATLPSSSASSVGRLAYTTDTKKLYVDNGSAFVVAGVGKFLSDTSWDGSTTVKNTDVSASVQDARNCIWHVRDNANNFQQMYLQIEATSSSNVRITSNVALPAGSYRLIGLE